MTIDVFMKNNNIKKKETVIKWIIEGLIPGGDLANNYVPDSARVPFTQARAKGAKSIYCSIIKATSKQRHVLPQLYNICLDEFNGYIDRLEAAGLIVKRETEGVMYYDLPLNKPKYTRKFIIDAIEACSKGITQGLTAAVLDKASTM